MFQNDHRGEVRISSTYLLLIRFPGMCLFCIWLLFKSMSFSTSNAGYKQIKFVFNISIITMIWRKYYDKKVYKWLFNRFSFSQFDSFCYWLNFVFWKALNMCISFHFLKHVPQIWAMIGNCQFCCFPPSGFLYPCL